MNETIFLRVGTASGLRRRAMRWCTQPSRVRRHQRKPSRSSAKPAGRQRHAAPGGQHDGLLCSRRWKEYRRHLRRRSELITDFQRLLRKSVGRGRRRVHHFAGQRDRLVTVAAMEEEMLLVTHPRIRWPGSSGCRPIWPSGRSCFEAVSNSRRVVDNFFLKGIDPHVMETGTWKS